MTVQKTWITGIVACLVLLLTSQTKLTATSAIYFDGKGNSHAIDETLKNPFPAKSKDEKALDIFLVELKKYKLCKIIYDGDTTSSTDDLAKKIDKDTQAAKAADTSKGEAKKKAEEEFTTEKGKAKTKEDAELRADEEAEKQELQGAAGKDQREQIKEKHKQNKENIKKKYRNKEKTGVVDELEKTKKAAIDKADEAAAAPFTLSCNASEDCADVSSCKTKSLAKDPTDEAKTKEVDVPKHLNGISVTHIYFCTCGKK